MLRPAGSVVMGLLIASTVFAACADPEPAPPFEPGEDSAPGRVPDAAPDAAPGDADARAPEPIDACSSAGWCATDIDRRLSFDDLWPLEQSAVAVASREGRSSVLVYENASWKVVHEVSFSLASVWASADDIWASGDGGHVLHGRRQGSDWTWTDSPLPVTSKVSVVLKASHDVYALADARVWRLSLDVDAGSPDSGTAWSVDYGGDSPEPETTLTALVGHDDDELWVTGARGSFPRCGLAIRKSGNAWKPVIEGIPTLPPEPWDPPSCVPVPGTAVFDGPILEATTTAKGEIVASTEASFTQGQSFVRIRSLPDGGAEFALAPRIADVNSLWGLSADDVYAASFSVLERGRSLWSDGGSWQVSPVAFAGVPVAKPFYVVRGTRSDNIWLAGESYAFHKTIP